MEERWWKSGTSHGGTVEHLIREQWNMLCWNSGTEMVEQGNRDGGAVDQLTVEQLNNHGETAEHLMLEQ